MLLVWDFAAAAILRGMAKKGAPPASVTLRDSLSGQALVGTGRVTYHLRDCVGEGGQGWAFRARWNHPEGVVVLAKVLRPDTVSLEALRRFQQEADVLRMLSMQPNPHVVRFYDHAVAQVPFAGQTIALPFTVLEFVNGPSLEQVLRTSGALAVVRVRRILRHVGQGLETVHQQKVVHRDLKPSNILLSTEGGQEVAKVTDFGLVKLAELNLVRTASLAGASIGYAPPEQYERGNQRVSPRTDVFSLAAVAYEMLSGRPAFPFSDGENPLVVVTRMLNGPRPSLVRIQTALPRELARRPEKLAAIDAVLAKGLAADPAHRYDGVRTFVNELDAALAPIEDAENVPRSLVSPFEATAPTDPGIVTGEQRSLASLGAGTGEQRSLASLGPGTGEQRSFAAASHEPPAFVPVVSPSGPPLSQKVDNLDTLPYGRPLRFSETVASQPSSWKFAVVARPPRPLGLRAAAIASSGEVAAVGAVGALVWDRGLWQPIALPRDIDPRAIRGAFWADGRDIVLYGHGSLVAVVSPRGTVTRVPVARPGVEFCGAGRAPDGSVWLVGEEPYRGSLTRSVPLGATAGVAVRLAQGRLDPFVECPDASRLLGVAVVGNEVLACGDRGALVRIHADRGELIGTLCHGNLYAISSLPDGQAVTVGAGGHALLVNERRAGQLEAVQTTRDLVCLSVAPDGSAWAGSASARLVRRSAGSWLRMTGELPTQANVVALSANESMVRAVLDDGALLEGRIVA